MLARCGGGRRLLECSSRLTPLPAHPTPSTHDTPVQQPEALSNAPLACRVTPWLPERAPRAAAGKHSSLLLLAAFARVGVGGQPATQVRRQQSRRAAAAAALQRRRRRSSRHGLGCRAAVNQSELVCMCLCKCWPVLASKCECKAFRAACLPWTDSLPVQCDAPRVPPCAVSTAASLTRRAPPSAHCTLTKVV